MALRAKVGQSLMAQASGSAAAGVSSAAPAGATDFPVASKSRVAAALDRTLSAASSSPVESQFLASAPQCNSATAEGVAAFDDASAWYLEVTPEAAASTGGTAGHYIRVVGKTMRCLLAGLHAPAQRIMVVASRDVGGLLVAAIAGHVTSRDVPFSLYVWSVSAEGANRLRCRVQLSAGATGAGAVPETHGLRAAAIEAAAACPTGPCSAVGAGVPGLQWLPRERCLAVLGCSKAVLFSVPAAVTTEFTTNNIRVETISTGSVTVPHVSSDVDACGTLLLQRGDGGIFLRVPGVGWKSLVTNKGTPLKVPHCQAACFVPVASAACAVACLLRQHSKAILVVFVLAVSAAESTAVTAKSAMEMLVVTDKASTDTKALATLPILKAVPGGDAPAVALILPEFKPPRMLVVATDPQGHMIRTSVVHLMPHSDATAASSSVVAMCGSGRPWAPRSAASAAAAAATATSSSSAPSMLVRVTDETSTEGAGSKLLRCTVPAAALQGPSLSVEEVVAARCETSAKVPAPAPAPAPAPVPAPAVVASPDASSFAVPATAKPTIVQPRNLLSPSTLASSPASHERPQRKHAVSQPAAAPVAVSEHLADSSDDIPMVPAASASASASAGSSAGSGILPAGTNAIAEMLSEQMRSTMALVVREAAAETAQAAATAVSEASDDLADVVTKAASPALQAAFIAAFQQQLAPAMRDAMSEMADQLSSAMQAAATEQAKATAESVRTLTEAAASVTATVTRAAERVNSIAVSAQAAADRAGVAADKALKAASSLQTAITASTSAARTARDNADAAARDARACADAANTVAAVADRLDGLDFGAMNQSSTSLLPVSTNGEDGGQASGSASLQRAVSESAESFAVSEAFSDDAIVAAVPSGKHKAPAAAAAAAAVSPQVATSAATSGMTSAVAAIFQSVSRAVPAAVNPVPAPDSAAALHEQIVSVQRGTASAEGPFNEALEMADPAAALWVCAELEMVGSKAALIVPTLGIVPQLCLFQQLASDADSHASLRIRWLAACAPQLRESADETIKQHLPGIAASAAESLGAIIKSELSSGDVSAKQAAAQVAEFCASSSG